MGGEWDIEELGSKKNDEGSEIVWDDFLPEEQTGDEELHADSTCQERKKEGS